MVIDTMIFAYALLGVPEFRDEAARVLAEVTKIHVPDSFRAELTNVVWQWVIHRGVHLETGIEILRDAEALCDHVHRSDGLTERALELAVQAKHPAYDAIFVALAERQELKVITFDRKLLIAFPELSITPAAYLSG